MAEHELQSAGCPGIPRGLEDVDHSHGGIKRTRTMHKIETDIGKALIQEGVDIWMLKFERISGDLRHQGDNFGYSLPGPGRAERFVLELGFDRGKAAIDPALASALFGGRIGSLKRGRF